MRLQLLFLIFLFYHVSVSAQEPLKPSVMRLFSARQFDQYQGDARIKQVERLRKNDWQAVDSMYGLPDQNGKSQLHINKTDLAPYVNEDGYIIYLVPEVAPQFPGGERALQQYKRDVLGSLATGPDGEVQRSVYISCIIDTNGAVTNVVEAQSHADWVSAEIIMQCLDAVQYMPAWTPGKFNGQAVRVIHLMEFSLKE